MKKQTDPKQRKIKTHIEYCALYENRANGQVFDSIQSMAKTMEEYSSKQIERMTNGKVLKGKEIQRMQFSVCYGQLCITVFYWESEAEYNERQKRTSKLAEEAKKRKESLRKKELETLAKLAKKHNIKLDLHVNTEPC